MINLFDHSYSSIYRCVNPDELFELLNFYKDNIILIKSYKGNKLSVDDWFYKVKSSGEALCYFVDFETLELMHGKKTTTKYKTE